MTRGRGATRRWPPNLSPLSADNVHYVKLASWPPPRSAQRVPCQGLRTCFPVAGQACRADHGFMGEGQVELFCVAANVAEETAHGEGGLELRRGIKHFPTGAKVWVLPPQWGDGGAKVIVA